MPAVAMLNGVSDALCKAMKTKRELLGEDSESHKADTLLELINAVSDSEEG